MHIKNYLDPEPEVSWSRKVKTGTSISMDHHTLHVCMEGVYTYVDLGTDEQFRRDTRDCP